MDQIGLTDEELIGKIANRDEAAIELLYDRYSSAIMGLALKILGERATAEEIVQETFLRVWNKANRYDAGRGAALSWLFAIAHHQCIDRLRRDQSSMETVEGRKVIKNVFIEQSVPAAAASVQRRHLVNTALASLPDEQRQVIEMAFFGGLTRQEIARQTGVPLGTVQTRARLALQKLRARLEEIGFTDE
ncbi:MAG TPA: sigma-70 family RNA polymerase sigma factor [Anaerolineales bacterium]|nr:sigma-70 family RNA polymerase sigma factor [Anaerolineales bacterium]